MMKILSAAILFVALPALPARAAGETVWPQKGDTVYVAAELTRTFMMPFSGSDTSTIPACVPFTVKSADDGGKRWDLRAGSSAKTRVVVRLEGPWRDRIVKTEKECESYYKVAGQPKIIRTGYVHTIPEG